MQKRRSRRERRRDPAFDVRSSMEITLLTVVSAGCGRLLLAGWEIPALLSVPQINRNGAFQSAEQAKKATPSPIRITQTVSLARYYYYLERQTALRQPVRLFFAGYPDARAFPGARRDHTTRSSPAERPRPPAH